MNFHFVDRILELEPGKRAVGIKHVNANDMYLTKTPSKVPSLYSCIVGEALGQLCSWNIIKATQGTVRSVGGIVSQVDLLGQAFIGDTILLDITIEHLDEQAVNWHGQAKVRGNPILVIHSSIGPCLPMEQFNELPEVRNHLINIDRPSALPELPEGQRYLSSGDSDDETQITYRPDLVNYDKIISWNSGKEVVAQKNISILAPYFLDHFPKKPVFPISIFIETQLQLAYTFLKGLLGDQADKFVPMRVSNIKMKDFIMPGDIIFTTMRLKQQTPTSIILSYLSEVNQRRICTLETEFGRKIL